MGLPKTIRLDEELEEKVEKYLDKNNIKFAQLINIAVNRFISEPQTIELKPIESAQWDKTVKKAFSKHKNAMDKLK